MRGRGAGRRPRQPGASSTMMIRLIPAAVRRIAQPILACCTPYVKFRLLGTLLLIAAGSVLMGLSPVALKIAVDRFSTQSADRALSFGLIAAYVASQFLSRVVTEIQGFVYSGAERRLFRALSERVFEHIMQLPLRFHLSRNTGAIAQTLENGLQSYQLVMNHLVFALLPGIVELATAMLVLLTFHHAAYLALFGIGMACYAGTWAYSTIRMASGATRASNAHVEATASMIDAVLNYEAVKSFAAERTVQDRVHRALVRTENEWIGFHRRSARSGLVVAIIYGAFFGATVIYAAAEVRRGRMTIGDFVLANTYLLQAVRPVEMLGHGVRAISQAVAMLGRMLDLLGERAEPLVTSEGASREDPAEVAFERVNLAYSPERTVLKDLSFRVAPGRTLAIVGSSGAGKSTIVRLLLRMIEPDSGRILLDGEPIATMPVSALRHAIAVVPQDVTLFDDTLAANIGFGKPGCSREEIEEAARTAQLHEFIMGLPERYETRVGERGVKLSGGERQRVAIARAVLKKPRIFVFDEATSSLDSRTERDLLSDLQKISRMTTTIIIAHRLSTVTYADEIVVLGGGMVLERGTHAELVESVGAYAGFWQAQRQ